MRDLIKAVPKKFNKSLDRIEKIKSRKDHARWGCCNCKKCKNEYL